MTPEQTLDWLAQQHWDQCREDRPIQDWIRKMKSELPQNNTVEAIKMVLNGIDQTETESPDGWWETSAGAEFGAKKLKYVIGLLAQPELCKYGQEPKSCTSSPMDCQCALDATFAQPEQESLQYGAVLEKIFAEAEKLFEEGIYEGRYINWHKALEEASKKYPAPQRTWVDLPDDIKEAVLQWNSKTNIINYVEEWLKEKNT